MKAKPTIQQELLKYLAAVECGLVYQHGVLLLAQPGLFAPETALIASMITGHTVLFCGCDKFSSAFLKLVGEKVALGFDKIVFLLDTPTIEHDIQWIAFVSAIAAGDTEFLKARLTGAELRGIVGKYAERVSVGKEEQQTEQELTAAFLAEFLAALKPILLCNPESSISDGLLTMAPPIRRSFAIVSFSILDGQPSTLDAVIQAVWADNTPEQRVAERLGAQIQKYRELDGIQEIPHSANNYIR